MVVSEGPVGDCRAGTDDERQNAVPTPDDHENDAAHTPPTRPRHPTGGHVPVRGLIGAFVAALIVVTATWALLDSQTYRPPVGTEVATPVGTAVVGGKVLPHVTLHLATYPDAAGSVGGVPVHPGGNRTWPAIGPTSNFQVPAHALVTISARQYDGGGALNDPWFATVRGTVGDVATVDGRIVHSIDPDAVGHTFLLQGLPGARSTLFVNVPFPAVATDWSDTGRYHTVVFSFVTGAPGTYIWNCEFPCGQMVANFGSAMSTIGTMSGFFHVV